MLKTKLIGKTMLTTLFGFFLLFSSVNLYSQNIFEDEDFHPPHPDSLSDFIDGMDIQLYNGGEAYVIKDKNINLPDAIELAKGFSEIYGSGFNAVPKVFDTSIKPDISKLPPLAKTADPALCNQIVWSEPMLLFEGRSFMSMAVVGDTVHAVTGLNLVKRGEQPYRVSTDGGVTFSELRDLAPEMTGLYPAIGGWTRVVANKNKVCLIFGYSDTISTGGLRTYVGYMRSIDGGNNFFDWEPLVNYEAFFSDVANSGDTIAVVIGDNRWTRGTPIPMYIYISTNFGETWKFRGYAGGRRVYDPRIALAGGWLHQTNEYVPPPQRTRNTEVAYYRSRVMRKNWLKRQVLSTNDGIASIQGDPVAEPNGFVGVIWNDGKYGSKYGWDGTPIFRRSLNYGKTFEPEVRLTDSPEASWGVMKLKSITTKLPVVVAVWCVTWENEYRTNAIRVSLDGGSSWCPIYYQHMGFGSLAPTAAVGNGKIYWAFDDVYVGSYFVRGILPNNLKTETAQTIDEGDKEDKQIIQVENYPNPFNPITNISYNLTQPGYVTLRVYDLLGREVKVLIDNEYSEEGEYEKEFNAEHLPSGIYYYRITLKNENGIKTKIGKMLLMK